MFHNDKKPPVFNMLYHFISYFQKWMTGKYFVTALRETISKSVELLIYPSAIFIFCPLFRL